MMKSSIRLLGYFILICAVWSCSEPLNVETENTGDKPKLVIEGIITNEPGPHFFYLTRISRYAGVREGGNLKFESNAKIYVIDSDNKRTNFENRFVTQKRFKFPPSGESCPAIDRWFESVRVGYQTPAGFKGEIGKSYTLYIESDGRTYKSTPQTIPSVPSVDSVSLRFTKLPSLDQNKFKSGVEVYANWKDPADTKNYYHWRVNGIYRIDTRQTIPGCCNIDPIDGLSTDCWIHENNIKGNKQMFSDVQSNGNQTRLKVGFIEDDGFRFHDQRVHPDKQYYVEVEQYGISPEAFQFHNLLSSQLDINGDIFDPPPASLRGNITNVNDSNDFVIGFFGAYSVKRQSTFVKRSMLEVIQRWTHPCGDCRMRAGGVNVTEIPEPYR